jgi:hypothetical protein
MKHSMNFEEIIYILSSTLFAKKKNNGTQIFDR